MKQAIIIIICILALVIGGIFEIKYLEKSSTYISYDLEYVKNAILNKNFSLAKEEMKKVKTTWEQEKTVWHFFVINEEIEDIDNALSELEEYINNEIVEDSLVKIALLRNYLDYSYNMQKVNLQTII